MLTRFAKLTAVSAVALCAFATAADAGCEGRTTTGTIVGAGTGGILGSVITHGSPVGIVGGAVVGGLAGHEIGRDGCTRHHYYRHHHRGYYDHYGHWHYYR